MSTEDAMHHAAATHEQLQTKHQELEALIKAGVEQLLSEVVPPGPVHDMIERDTHDVFDRLGRDAADLMTRLSEGHVSAARQQLKAQFSTFETKLEHSRTAARVQLQDQQAELEATHAKDTEEKIAKLLNGGDDALREAHTAAEAAKAALKELKFKFEGSETALSMAQVRLKAAEEQVVTLSTELEQAARRRDQLEAVQAKCKEQIDAEAASLKLSLPKEELKMGLDKRVEAVLEQHEHRKTEFARAQQSVNTALDVLTISSEESWTMDERIGALVKTVEDERSENARSQAESAERIASLEHDVQSLTDELEALVHERDALQTQVAELTTTLQNARAEAEAKIATLESEVEAGARRNRQLEAEVEETRGKLVSSELEVKRLGKLAAEAEAMQQAFEARLEEAAEKLAAEHAAHAATEEAYASHKADAEEERARLNAKVSENEGAIKTLRDELSGAQRTITDRDGAVAALKEQLATTRQSLDQMLNAGGDVDSRAQAQVDFFKKEAAKHANAVEALEMEMASAKSTLENTLVDLKVKVDKNRSLKEQLGTMIQEHNKTEAKLRESRQQAASLEAEIAEAKGTLMGQNGWLRAPLEEKETLRGQLAKVMAECKAVRDELADARALLHKTLKTLQITVDTKDSLELQLQKLVSEFNRVKEEIARTRQKLRQVLESLQIKVDANQTLDQQLTELDGEYRTCLRRVYTALYPGVVARAPPSGKLRIEEPLSVLVPQLIDRWYAATYGMEQMEREAKRTQGTMLELRTELDRLDHSSKAEVRSLREAAKNERARLIGAALGSLQQLRSHMVAAVATGPPSGTREVPPQPADFARNPFTDRWGVVDDHGRFDEASSRLDGALPAQSPLSSPRRRQQNAKGGRVRLANVVGGEHEGEPMAPHDLPGVPPGVSDRSAPPSMLAPAIPGATPGAPTLPRLVLPESTGRVSPRLGAPPRPPGANFTVPSQGSPPLHGSALSRALAARCNQDIGSGPVELEAHEAPLSSRPK